MFGERSLDDPALGAARAAVELLLAAHEPHPALAVDRHWAMFAANRPVATLLDGVAHHLLAPPVNVLRLSLHPEGLAPRLLNYGEWRSHILERLRHQHRTTLDPALADLRAELANYPPPPSGAESARAPDDPLPVVPLRLASRHGDLSFLSTTTVFGTPLDVTLSEIAVESFFPSDAATAGVMRAIHDDRQPPRDGPTER